MMPPIQRLALPARHSEREDATPRPPPYNRAPGSSFALRHPTGEPSLMRFTSARLGLACLIPTVGYLACLAADETRTETGPARWRQHDVHRPKPPVVEPADSPIAAKPP